MSSAVTDVPSSLRSRFSRRILSEYGSRLTSPTPSRAVECVDGVPAAADDQWTPAPEGVGGHGLSSRGEPLGPTLSTGRRGGHRPGVTHRRRGRARRVARLRSAVRSRPGGVRGCVPDRRLVRTCGHVPQRVARRGARHRGAGRRRRFAHRGPAVARRRRRWGGGELRRRSGRRRGAVAHAAVGRRGGGGRGASST